MSLFLASRGHRVTVIASPVSYLTGKNTPPKVERDAGGKVTIHRTYTYAALHRSFVHRVFSFLSFMLSSFWMGLKVKDVDLVWGTSPPIFQGVTAWALARLKGARFLMEVRDLWPAFAIAVGVLRNPLLIRLSQWLERFLLRRADRVMVNSPGFIEHVKAKGARHVALVPNGADTRMFDPDDDGHAFRDAHHLHDKYIALYAGAHGMSNDLGIVLQAARLLRDQPEIAIVLLGDGKEKAQLLVQAAEIGLDNVHFLPPVPKTQMGAALAGADACIGILKPVPLYATVYPNKIFDYMAAGRPVVLAMEGVIREVVEKAGAGIPVPPGDAASLADAIRALAADTARAGEMGQAGRAYVAAHFDRAAQAEKLIHVMEKSGDKKP